MPKKKKQALKIPKPIKIFAKVLETISPRLAARFAMRIFITPVKFKLPKREVAMDSNTHQEMLNIPVLNKEICVYHYGSSKRKVLLVHGWSGRGTQLYSIADKLLKNGYSTISFDAPGHGKSSGKTSDMTEFIQCILELDKKYGPFEYAIGHSLGAMATLNAIKRGLNVEKAVIIGSGDVIEDIMNHFTRQMGMEIATGKLMIRLFEKKFGEAINSYSAYVAAKEVKIPVLVIHDQNDHDVPAVAAYHIYENLAESELIITEGLGHRKILGDTKVIKQIMQFLNDEKDINVVPDSIADSMCAGKEENS